jgi:class 3 adenylate cyclase
VAARICSQAKGGAILVSKGTAERVKEHFSFEPLGRFALKNLTEEVEIFAI